MENANVVIMSDLCRIILSVEGKNMQ